MLRFHRFIRNVCVHSFVHLERILESIVLVKLNWWRLVKYSDHFLSAARWQWLSFGNKLILLAHFVQ